MSFWDNIVITDTGCWLWTGSIHPKGYGLYSRRNRTFMAHRYAFESYHDVRLSQTTDVHHLCRTKRCISPLHTTDVPHNNHPDSASGGNLTKTHCVNGHKFSEQNTYLRTRTNGKQHRMCKACRAEGMATLAKARLEALK